MQITIRIAGDEYTLTRDDILRVAQSTRPERIDTFYVAVEGKHFPPTQLIREATGTSHRVYSFNARSALTRLGFEVKAQS
jgi:hypothetical protein